MNNSDDKKVRHVSFAVLPVEHLNPLLERQYVSAEKGMLAKLLLRKGCVVPLHHHENEQITFIMEGALKFIVEGQELVVRGGEVLVIPPNVPHSAEALEDTIDVDVFSPPRADWLAGTDSYLRK